MATTPAGFCATDRAAALTDMLAVCMPLAELSLNRPTLELPATAHRVPSASGPVAPSSARGAGIIRGGRKLRVPGLGAAGALLPVQEVTTMTLDSTAATIAAGGAIGRAQTAARSRRLAARSAGSCRPVIATAGPARHWR